MPRAHVRSILVLLLLALAHQAPAQEARPFTAQDLWEMERLSAWTVSPDGGTIVFVRRTTDFEANRGRTDLWSIRADGSDLRRLTTHEASDNTPLWAPDGSSLFFLSTRSGSSQLWRIPIGGGEPEQVTDLPVDVANPVLSPDGRKLAFTVDVFVDCDSLDCTVSRLDEREESPETGVVYDELFVRHWDTWTDGRRSHLFVLDLPPGSEQGGDAEPVDVTSGLNADVPSKPFGGAEEIAFTPNGSELVFTAREGGSDEAWSTDFDLYRVPADGSKPPQVITDGNEAWDTLPVFSPDGETLAYLAMERPGYESDRFGIRLRSWESGATRELAGDWDRSVSEMVFSPDGATLWVTASDVGEVNLFAIDVASGKVSEIADGGHVRGPTPLGDRVLFGMDTLTGPVDLYSVAPDGSDRQQLTEINAERLAEIEMGEYEQFSFAGWNDESVHGYVVKPPGLRDGGKAPVAFLIHGGPQGSFGNDFHYRWNPQVYAGAGYGAVMIDFHGSTGYGQAFTDSIEKDWGGKPLEDLQKGLAAAIERYPWLDGDRVCALGASYGGYMINWIAGNWPDRFRCLVNHDGVFDHRTMYFETEELWFVEREHGGPYFANPESHERHNPVLHVDQWRTPMLVVQGELDYRVPVSQGLGAFTALQRRGIPSRLLYFPDENHWVLSPANGLQWHREVLEWLERWLE